MNLNELKASRHDSFCAAEKLVKAAKQAGKDLAGADLEEYQENIAEMKKLDGLIAKCEQGSGRMNPGSRFGGNGQPQAESEWVDTRTGGKIPVLRPDQRMSDLVSPQAQMDEPLSLGKLILGKATGNWKHAERELKAMNEGSLAGGQVLVPTPLSLNVIDRVRNAAVVLQAGARTIAMDSQTLAMARVAASGGDITPMWHTEAAAITPSDMTFEKVTFTAQTLAALASFSVELLEDANGLEPVIIDSLAKVLAIEVDRACLRGTGTAPQLKGILNQTGVTIDASTFGTNGSVISAAAPTGAVAWDWLSKQVSALWGVNEKPNAAIYSARTAGELDLLRASTGAVLPPPGSVADLQRLFTNSIPNNLTQGTGTTCSEAYVGDFTQAMIGMRTALILEISRYGNVGSTSMFSTMQIGLRAYLRCDFQLARPAAFRVVTGIL